MPPSRQVTPRSLAFSTYGGREGGREGEGKVKELQQEEVYLGVDTRCIFHSISFHPFFPFLQATIPRAPRWSRPWRSDVATRPRGQRRMPRAKQEQEGPRQSSLY